MDDGVGPELPRSFRFARNFRWSLLGQGAGLAVSFVATPILIARLGLEQYGLYLLVLTAGGYLSLLTLGAGAASVRYIAALRAAGDGRGLRRAERYSLLFHGPVVLAGAAALAAAARPILDRLFHVPAPLLDAGTSALMIGALGASFAALTQSAACVMQGLHRFEAQAATDFLKGTMTTVGAAALATAGVGLRGVVAWYAAWNALVAALALAWSATLLRRAAPDAGPGRLRLREFFVWSVSQWFGQIAWIVSNQFDRVFAARYGALSGLALYAVPLGLLQRLQTLPATVSAVTLPLMSELRGPEHRDTFQRLYLRSTRLLFALGLPALALLFCLIPQFLSLWLGGEFGDRAVWPARLQIVAQVFVLLAVIPDTAAFALGRPWHHPALSWSQAVLSVAAWALLRRWGLVGIAGGVLIAQALSALAYVPLIQGQVVGVGVGRLLREGLLAPAASAAAVLALVFPVHAWAGTWTRLVGVGAAATLVYAAVCWALLPAEDRETLRRYVRWERGLAAR